jgi:hypothetical protein
VSSVAKNSRRVSRSKAGERQGRSAQRTKNAVAAKTIPTTPSTSPEPQKILRPKGE